MHDIDSSQRKMAAVAAALRRECASYETKGMRSFARGTKAALSGKFERESVRSALLFHMKAGNENIRRKILSGRRVWTKIRESREKQEDMFI